MTAATVMSLYVEKLVLKMAMNVEMEQIITKMDSPTVLTLSVPTTISVLRVMKTGNALIMKITMGMASPIVRIHNVQRSAKKAKMSKSALMA